MVVSSAAYIVLCLVFLVGALGVFLWIRKLHRSTVREHCHGEVSGWNTLLDTLLRATSREEAFGALCAGASDQFNCALIAVVVFDAKGTSYSVLGRTPVEGAPGLLIDRIPLTPGTEYVPDSGGRIMISRNLSGPQLVDKGLDFFSAFLSVDEARGIVATLNLQGIYAYPLTCQESVRGAIIAFQRQGKPSPSLDLLALQCSLVLRYTEQIQSLEEKARNVHQLEQFRKMEAIGRLAGGIAHDFNNLLSAILGAVSLLNIGVRKTQPYYGEVETIEAAATQAAELTRRLLSFARGGQMHIAPLNVNEIAEKAALFNVKPLRKVAPCPISPSRSSTIPTCRRTGCAQWAQPSARADWILPSSSWNSPKAC